jgi:type IV secretory pathway TraG/TraD family ATPase VirD4
LLSIIEIFEAIVVGSSECRYRLLLVFQSTGTIKGTHGQQGKYAK